MSAKKIKNFASRALSTRHQNVAAFCGFSLEPSGLLFEYCEVRLARRTIHTLSELIQIVTEDRQFVFRERLSYCHQAIEGLMYLHQNGIIHQDVKPENMLVSGSPSAISVKLCDYGEMSYFKETCATSTRIKPGFVGLTLTYVAPEICLIKVVKPTKETDAYALGISTFEIFSGLKNAWEKTFAIQDNYLLIESLKKGGRPDSIYLDEKYDENDCQLIKKMLEVLWVEKNLEKVSCFFLNLFCSEYKTVSTFLNFHENCCITLRACTKSVIIEHKLKTS